MKPETHAIHAGKIADTAFNSVMPPLYPTSTFAFDHIAANKGFDYTRSGNPTRKALEDCIARIENGAGAVCTATGMAAHAAGARKLAEVLCSDHRVEAVHYPGLPSHPQIALARRQMSGFGGSVKDT